MSVRLTLFELLPEDAVNAAVSALWTDATLAVKLTLLAFAGTVTVDGTTTAALLLESRTLTALRDAFASVTVQTSAPVPVKLPLEQEKTLNAGACAALRTNGQQQSIRSKAEQ